LQPLSGEYRDHVPADRPLRIGLVSDCYVPRLGGIEMQVHDLARHLQGAGHEVVVITPTPGPAVMDGVRVQRIDEPLLPFDIPFTPKAFRLVADLLERERVEVAHFHGGIASPLAFGAARAAQRAGVPTAVTVHCMWSYATPVFAALDRAGHWTEWPIVLSSVSNVAAEPIRRIAGPDREVLVLPNGIDNDQWVVEPVDRDPGVVTLVSVMRLAPRKRPLQLLKMIRRVVARIGSEVTLKVIIIGEGPERPQLEKFLRTNGLTEVVDLVGRRNREEIREIFGRSDAFVAPANLESFGIAALEARCAGLPVVAKSRTGIREFVEHGREGLLASTDADMVDQLTRIVRDTELRTVITKHNRETPSPVDWSEVVARNVAAYRVAIEMRAGTPGLPGPGV
jgi:glycosyltransferase involved in cell wall biosynthesis